MSILDCVCFNTPFRERGVFTLPVPAGISGVDFNVTVHAKSLSPVPVALKLQAKKQALLIIIRRGRQVTKSLSAGKREDVRG